MNTIETTSTFSEVTSFKILPKDVRLYIAQWVNEKIKAGAMLCSKHLQENSHANISIALFNRTWIKIQCNREAQKILYYRDRLLGLSPAIQTAIEEPILGIEQIMQQDPMQRDYELLETLIKKLLNNVKNITGVTWKKWNTGSILHLYDFALIAMWTHLTTKIPEYFSPFPIYSQTIKAVKIIIMEQMALEKGEEITETSRPRFLSIVEKISLDIIQSFHFKTENLLFPKNEALSLENSTPSSPHFTFQAMPNRIRWWIFYHQKIFRKIFNRPSFSITNSVIPPEAALLPGLNIIFSNVKDTSLETTVSKNAMDQMYQEIISVIDHPSFIQFLKILLSKSIQLHITNFTVTTWASEQITTAITMFWLKSLLKNPFQQIQYNQEAQRILYYRDRLLGLSPAIQTAIEEPILEIEQIMQQGPMQRDYELLDISIKKILHRIKDITGLEDIDMDINKILELYDNALINMWLHLLKAVPEKISNPISYSQVIKKLKYIIKEQMALKKGEEIEEPSQPRFLAMVEKIAFDIMESFHLQPKNSIFQKNILPFQKISPSPLKAFFLKDLYSFWNMSTVTTCPEHIRHWMFHHRPRLSRIARAENFFINTPVIPPEIFLLTHLKNVHLMNWNIKDISILEQLQELSFMTITSKKISFISLKKLRNLQFLMLPQSLNIKQELLSGEEPISSQVRIEFLEEEEISDLEKILEES